MTILSCFLLILAGTSGVEDSGRRVEMKASAERVGKYEKLELAVGVGMEYANPFDPDEVELTVMISGPGGERMELPGFFCQDYERRKTNQGRTRANWFYPVGTGGWRARFAPMQTGSYSAVAVLRDKGGVAQSGKVRFACGDSRRKGFLRVGKIYL